MKKIKTLRESVERFGSPEATPRPVPPRHGAAAFSQPADETWDLCSQLVGLGKAMLTKCSTETKLKLGLFCL